MKTDLSISRKSKTTEGNLGCHKFSLNFTWMIFFVISSFSWFMKLIVIYVESSFHVIPYLAWKWFKFLIFFYLTFLSLWGAIYTPGAGYMRAWSSMYAHFDFGRREQKNHRYVFWIWSHFPPFWIFWWHHKLSKITLL